MARDHLPRDADNKGLAPGTKVSSKDTQRISRNQGTGTKRDAADPKNNPQGRGR